MMYLGICIVVLSLPTIGTAQQFNSDNQWVAPHGVATLIGTAGQEFAQAYLVAALLPEWEFNAVLTHYYDDPAADNGAYTATNLYAKRRLSENEAGTAGYAVFGGTGIFPGHRDQGERMQAFDSWYMAGIATYAFAGDKVLLDLLPGVVANLDQGPSSKTAWGFTYSTRIAVYDVLPRAALVGEVFGTAGEAGSEPSYRLGLRWETPRWVFAASYSDAFDGSYGAGFEVGIMYYTNPRFCFSGCSR